MASAVVGALRAVLSADTADFDKAMKGADANIRKLADSMQKQLVPSQSRVNSLVKNFLGSREIGMAKAYAQAIEQVGDASKLSAKHQADANAAALKALDAYKRLGQAAPPGILKLAVETANLKKNTDQLGTSLSTVAPHMNKVGMSADDLLGKAKALAGMFGVTLGVSAIGSFVASVFHAADEIGDLALKMGVSTDAAQRFQFAARQSGIEIEEVSKAVTHLNSGLGEGKDSGVAKALGALGLSFEQIRAMKPEDAFRATAKAIGEITDPMEQAAAAAAVFGEKLGAQLLPMIREGSLDAAENVRVMTADQIKALKDAQQAWENFGKEVTLVAGEMFADLLKSLGIFLTDWTAGWEAVARIIAMNPLTVFLQPGQFAKLIAADVAASKAGKAPLPYYSDIPGGMAEVGAYGGMFGGRTAPNSTPGSRRFDVEWERKQKEAAKRAESVAADAKKFNDAVADYINQMSTGMTAAQREMQKVRAAALSRLGLTGAYGLADSLVGPMNLAALLGGGSSLDMTRPYANVPSFDVPINQKAMLPLLFRGGLSWDDLTKGVVPPDTFGTLFGRGVGGAMGNLPQTILQAITGGGNVGQSIGSLFGSQIGSSVIGKSTDGIFGGGLGKMLQKSFLGDKIGGMVANFIPGLGALLGPALGKLFGAIGGIGANTTKGARGDFAKSMGFESLDNLYAKLRSLSAEGEKLANVGLNVIGKKDKAANEKWMKDVTAFFDRLERVPGKVNELSQALGRFGGAIPDQLSPLLDSILGNPNLSADLRMQLEGMRKPSWQAAQEMAQALGVNPGALGAGFNQSRLAEQAFSLKRALDTFAKFAGSDQNAILKDMADEFSALAADAKRTGAALPRAIQAFLRSVDEMGLLLDENGNRIDSSLLTFADIEDEYLAQAVSLLEQIRDLLTPPSSPTNPTPPGFTPRLPGVPPPTPTPPGTLPVPGDPGFQMSMPSLTGPSYSGSFAADTGALTPADQFMTVIVESDGRQISRIVMPYIAGEVRRLGLAKA